jgi:hypothetical protein
MVETEAEYPYEGTFHFTCGDEGKGIVGAVSYFDVTPNDPIQL